MTDKTSQGMVEQHSERPGSARRYELLERTIEYVSQHGYSELSLRPLAAAIGTSPGVLMYLFGSKEGLLTEVFSVARERELELIDGAREGAGEPAEAVMRLWRSWLADPGRAALMRLFFENYLRSLHDAKAYGDFATASVREWLEFLKPLTEDAADPVAEATLTLAVLRGLLLDALATGDHDRVERALTGYLALIQRG